MYDKQEGQGNNESRVLMFSQRNISTNLLYRCAFYEFEDLVRQIDSVELLAPQPNKWFKYRYRVANRISQDSTIVLNPGIPKIRIKTYYDIFFAACQLPFDLLQVNAVEGWRENCGTSICLLSEVYVKDLLKLKGILKILSKFDYVMLNFSQSVDAINEEIRGECFYMPPGIDALLFCPYPESHRRVIDVYSIGRKSEITHQKLLRFAKEKKLFYVYDTLDGNFSTTTNPTQHRLMIAETAKRSRYFIVNPGKRDLADETGNQSEIGFRFFEGAAAGTIMIGEYPQNEEFKRIFYWPDAVVHLPFDSENIDTIINELDNEPFRQEQILRNNVVQSLLRHDWVYRWETMLKAAGLKPMPELLKRKERLENLSKMVEKERTDL